MSEHTNRIDWYFRFQIPQPGRHVGDPVGVLRRDGRRKGRQDRRGEALEADELQGIRVGKGRGHEARNGASPGR